MRPKGALMRARLSGRLVCLALWLMAASVLPGDLVEPEPAAVRWLVLPFPIYGPDTGAALTVTGLGLYRSQAASQTSSLLAFGTYSQRRQGMLMVAPQLTLRDETLWVEGAFSVRDWPDRYYGVGHDTSRGDRETYTSRGGAGALTVRHAVVRHWSAGFLFRYADYRVTDVEPGGLLAQGTAFGSGGLRVGGLGLQAVWDNRDDRFAPKSGSFFNLAGVLYETSDDGAGFQRVRVDARCYLPLGEHGILALQHYANLNFGHVPFQEMSRIGDMRDVGLMRGYYTGRYLDRHLALLQAEWRFPLYRRVGAVLFASAGVLGDNLLEGSRHSVYAAGGAGVRYRALSGERVNLRLDIAFGEERPGIYFSIMEAF